MVTWELISSFSRFLCRFHFAWFNGQKSSVSPFFLQFFVLDFLTVLSSNWVNCLILGCPVGLFTVNFNYVALVCLSYQQSMWFSFWYICGRHCVLNAATRQLLPQFCIRRFQVPILQYRLTNLTEDFLWFSLISPGNPETVLQIRLLFLHFINLSLGTM